MHFPTLNVTRFALLTAAAALLLGATPLGLAQEMGPVVPEEIEEARANFPDAGDAQIASMVEGLTGMYRGEDHTLYIAPVELPDAANALYVELVMAGEENKPQAETLAWFLSLTDLEAWTWNHPTHDAIFKNFMVHAQRFNFEVDVLLGHEVSIVPEGGGRAEYHNCHPATGFLRFFDSVDCA